MFEGKKNYLKEKRTTLQTGGKEGENSMRLESFGIGLYLSQMLMNNQCLIRTKQIPELGNLFTFKVDVDIKL